MNNATIPNLSTNLSASPAFSVSPSTEQSTSNLFNYSNISQQNNQNITSYTELQNINNTTSATCLNFETKVLEELKLLR